MALFHQARDQYNFVVENTPMDEMRTAIPVRLVGATFPNGGNAGAVDANFWTAAQTGTLAGSTQANGQVVITSGTDATGTASIQTVRRARYNGGSANRFRSQIQLGDTGNADNIRRWGMFDGTDGAYFELNGTTLNVVTIKTGTPSRVASASWNNNTTTPTLTNINTYEIYITNAKVYFVINGVLKHTVSATSTTWADNLNFPVRIDSTNSAGSTAYTITCRVATIYRLGELMTSPTYKNITGVSSSQILKYGAGVLHSIGIGTPVNNATITVYDNTTGTTNKIGLLTLPNSATPFVWDFGSKGLTFSNGLNIVPSSTSLDLTINYE